MVAVGYSDRSQAFIVRNSWGTEWVKKLFFSKTSSFFGIILGL
jgi:hypothetical protein